MKLRLQIFTKPVEEILKARQKITHRKEFRLALEESGLNRASLNLFRIALVNKAVLERSIQELESVTRTMVLQSMLCALFTYFDSSVIGVSLVLLISAVGTDRRVRQLKTEVLEIEKAFTLCQNDIDTQKNEALHAVFGN